MEIIVQAASQGFCIMSFPAFSRRTTLKIGAGAFAGLSLPALAADAKHHFLPACRIGLIVPEGVEITTDANRLRSADHGLSIDVYEQLRLGPDGDDHIWEKDDRSERVEPSIRRNGFEIREFRDLRYGEDKDYGARSIILRDRDWMGQVEISTQDFGQPPQHPEGMIAHWRKQTEAVFASIIIRPQPPIEQALAELGIRLHAPDLHPRITGRNLILSLAPPRTNLEAWAANGTSIRAASLMNLIHYDGSEGNWEGLVLQQIESTKAMARKAGFEPEVLHGPHARGVKSAELEFMEGRFSTTLHLLSPSRFFDFTAYYDAQSREPILAALQRIVERIEFIAPT